MACRYTSSNGSGVPSSRRYGPQVGSALGVHANFHYLDFSMAADYMTRALFAYERAFTGAFNLASGYHRLDFDRVENRVFYLAVARNTM